MKTITIQVYNYAELAPAAREKARCDFLTDDNGALSDGWWSEVFEDVVPVAAVLGIDIDMDRSGEPAVYFTGFGIQGQCASFTARYTYRKGASDEIRAHAPTDGVLHSIADALQAAQRRYFYRLEATVRPSRVYGVDVDVTLQDDPWRDAGDAGQEIRAQMEAFANWVFRQLQREHESRTSEDFADECLSGSDRLYYRDGGVVSSRVLLHREGTAC